MNNYYQVVKSKQSDRRFQHTLGVVAMAKQLSEVYNVDSADCELAALLHDVTKQFDQDSQQQFLAKVEDQFIIDNPPLWHSYTGALYASDVLKVSNHVIIEAIKYHTTGKLNCNEITKVIYISDYLELGRDIEELNQYRDLIGKIDLNQLYLKVAKSRIEYELNRGHVLHPDTKELYESII